MPIQKAIDIPAFLALSPRERVLKFLKTIGLDEEFYDLEAKGAQLEKDRFVASTAKSEANVRLRNIPDRVLPDDLKEEDSILAAMEENVRRCDEKARIMAEAAEIAQAELDKAEARRDEYMPEVMAKKESELAEQRAMAQGEVVGANRKEQDINERLVDTALKLDQLSRDHLAKVSELSIVDGDLNCQGVAWSSLEPLFRADLVIRILKTPGVKTLIIDRALANLTWFQDFANAKREDGYTLVLKED